MKPILFSTPMVQAILAGDKTQTRRIVRFPNDFTGDVYSNKPYGLKYSSDLYGGTVQRLAYALPDDILWVRETYWQAGDWRQSHPEDDEWKIWAGSDKFFYAADGLPPNEPNRDYPEGLSNEAYSAADPNRIWRKMPSIFMPREACRLFLKVKSVRVERLQDISEEDAKAEGVPQEPTYPKDFSLCPNCGGEFVHLALGGSLGVTEVDCNTCDTSRKQFKFLWDKINGKRASWESNPWVWVIEFEKTDKP